MDRSPLTEQSPPGAYFVITQSRSIFHVVLDPDGPATITRYRVADNDNLLDGVPLTGLGGFRFDARTGEGTIAWWKERTADRDVPDEQYAGTIRRTSQVRLVLRDASVRESIAPGIPPCQWPEAVSRDVRARGSWLDDLRLGLWKVTDEEFEDFIAVSFFSQDRTQ